jgi:tRNA (Thr-GGU) A37 N-methylase
MSYLIEPVALITAARKSPEDDFWGGATAEIKLLDSIDESALKGVEAFSHVEIFFVFHQVPEDTVMAGERHPRNNEAWPKVGIFALSAKNRPNRIGSTIYIALRIAGQTLATQEIDAIDGTPEIDIKPVLKEFLPR